MKGKVEIFFLRREDGGGCNYGMPLLVPGSKCSVRYSVSISKKIKITHF